MVPNNYEKRYKFIKKLKPIYQTNKVLAAPFILKRSPASILLKKVANINKGSSQPNKIIVGHVTNFQLEEIANIKMQDLNTKNLITAKKIVHKKN